MKVFHNVTVVVLDRNDWGEGQSQEEWRKVNEAVAGAAVAINTDLRVLKDALSNSDPAVLEKARADAGHVRSDPDMTDAQYKDFYG